MSGLVAPVILWIKKGTRYISPSIHCIRVHDLAVTIMSVLHIANLADTAKGAAMSFTRVTMACPNKQTHVSAWPGYGRVIICPICQKVYIRK